MRASLLGLCLNSLHKTDVWAYALGLRSGPVHKLFSTPINLHDDAFEDLFEDLESLTMKNSLSKRNLEK